MQPHSKSNNNLVLIKLGGSAITDKQRFETLKPEVLEAIAESLASAIAQTQCTCVLVHGAGSFGHHQARDSGVARGGSVTPTLTQGFAATRHSVLKLSQHTVGSLLAAGIAATPLSPCGVWNKQGGSQNGIEAVKSALSFGLVPVLHGDCVFDAKQGCAVLSGDRIIIDLAIALRPRCTIFMTDVDGLLDRPPSEAGATLVREVWVKDDGKYLFGDGRTNVTMTAAQHDVTGGIAAKVGTAADIARHGLPVWIVRADSRSAAQLLNDVDGTTDESWRGTVIRHIDHRACYPPH